MKNVVAFVCGLLFGVGLLLSGMTDPHKVRAFLDLAGEWDPSLAFVMLGAIAVAAPAFAWAKRRTHSLGGAPMQIPKRSSIDLRLVLGSVCFGSGWGLAGFCPGPALVSAASGQPKAWLFSIGMLIGMAAFSLVEHLRARIQRMEGEITRGL